MANRSNLRHCDLVMEGGVTSGVVYPWAVCRLALSFRFKNIGGTSAGAIAAAASAAAELGRDSKDGGFELLKALPEDLGKTVPGAGRSNLFALFQPQKRTAKVFDTATAALGGGGSAIVRVLLRACLSFPIAAVLGALPGLVLLWLARGVTLPWLKVLLGGYAVIVLLVGLIGTVMAWFAYRAVSSIPKNDFGLCNGMPGHRAKGEALTPWLASYLNRLAGRDPAGSPLTFADLWGTRDPNAPRQINLEMMTTCLSLGRPFRLPFRDDGNVRENRNFYFDPAELRKLFPERIVEWMVDHPRPVADSQDSKDRRARMAKLGLHPLPDPADLPVIVAVRMSLSFPVLLSAVPLYAVDYGDRDSRSAPEHCWFSDGGITSNFPVHFFDSPLPRWPTFAIKLDEASKTHGVGFWMPKDNGQGMQPVWTRFESGGSLSRVGGFLWSILSAARNWGDGTQCRLPGYRDRIAHVALDENDGGLNLDMDDAKIKRLAGYGRDAGEELRRRFTGQAPDVKLNWKNHRWVRLRSMLSASEESLRRLQAGLENPEDGDRFYAEWLHVSVTEPPPSYTWSSQRHWQLACDTLAALEAAGQVRRAAHMQEDLPLATKAPRPRPELRMRPRI